jgi:thiazole synthase
MLSQEVEASQDSFVLEGRTFSSRLGMGTSHFPDFATCERAIRASGTEIVTLAIRRIDFEQRNDCHLLSLIEELDLAILPNTAGCFTAYEAVLTAHLAREALQTNWVKLEVIGDERTCFPNNEELLKAARQLVRDGFSVFPFCSDDLIVCQKLQDIGCAAVMPFGSLIGTGRGINNPYHLELIREQIHIPLIIDAGIGTASDAAIAMELGADAILLNRAIAKSQHPVLMAHAMKEGCQAGRKAFLAGRMPKSHYAVASSPKIGRIQCGKC